MCERYSDVLVIENSKEFQELCCFAVIVTPIIFFAVYIETRSIVDSLIVTFPALLGVLSGIAEAKRITMDKNGCKVEILFLNRFAACTKSYKWDDFKVKVIMDCSKICRDSKYGFPYKNAVVMSVRKKNIPKNLRLDTIAVFFPISFHYVYFKRYDVKNLSRAKSSTTYEVDETLFRVKMAEWGVELEEAYY